MNLADLLAPGRAPAARLRTATVTAVAGPTVTLALGDASLAGVPRLSSYAPVAGHTVAVLQYGTQLLVLGTTT